MGKGRGGITVVLETVLTALLCVSSVFAFAQETEDVTRRLDFAVEETLVEKTLLPNKETVKLEYGKSFGIGVSSSEIGADIGDVTYISSDTSVATVNKDGVITAVGDGYATITIESELSGDCTVAVSALPFVPAV